MGILERRNYVALVDDRHAENGLDATCEQPF